MKATVYTGAGTLGTVDVDAADVRRGVAYLECPACNGTGVFEITDSDAQDCNKCKTRGEIPVSL